MSTIDNKWLEDQEARSAMGDARKGEERYPLEHSCSKDLHPSRLGDNGNIESPASDKCPYCNRDPEGRVVGESGQVRMQCHEGGHSFWGDLNIKSPASPSEISVVEECERNAKLNDKNVLEMLEMHIVDYPTPENIAMQRKYIQTLKAPKPVISQDDIDAAWSKGYNEGLEDGGKNVD